MTRAFQGDAFGGVSGMGPWEEGEPWACFVQHVGFGMDALYRAKGLAERPAPDFERLNARWELALDRMRGHCSATLPEGRWLMHSGVGTPSRMSMDAGWEPERTGAAMLAIREAIEMEQAAQVRSGCPSLRAAL